MAKNVLIIGAGPAGLAAAEAVVSLGAMATLCGMENHPPYWRPRLTRYLLEPTGVESLAIRKPEWYAQHGVNLMTGKVAEKVDPANRQVFWETGEVSPYEALVIATGSSPCFPTIPGAENALALRSYDDAVRIRIEALNAGSAIVIGGGLLGLETAWELNAAGIKVTVVERSPWLMPRQLNREGGNYLQKKLESSGIKLMIGRDPAELAELYKGACVVIAAGSRPSLSIIEGIGISTGKGITVDNRMRTSAEGIYACGDVAEYMGRCWGLLPVAQEQGKVAGLNAAGGDAVYVETPPSPMLKVGSLTVFSVGDSSEAEGVLSIKEENESGYACLMIKENILVGAVLIGNTAAGMKLRKAVGEKKELIGIKSVHEAITAL